MDLSTESISTQWQNLLAFTPRLIGALLILFLFYLLGRFLSMSLSALIRRISKDRIHETFFRTFIKLLCLYLGVILALNVVGLEKLSLSILAGGGVTAIVLGFAFREIGENFIAGVFLAFSRPFNVGDLINSEGIEGRVQSIQLRNTHLRADDGRDIFVPSSQLFSKPVINYTRDGLRRFSFNVGIDYANDAKAACDLLLDAVTAFNGVLEDPAPATSISSLEPQYVELIVHYWQNVFDGEVDGRALRINVMDACRKALLENNYTVSAETTSNIAVTGNINQ